MSVLGVYFVRLMIFVSCAQCVLFSDGQTSGSNAGGGRVGVSVDDDDGSSENRNPMVSTAIKSCLAGADPFLPCINEHAMAVIEQTETMDSVLLDSGLEISKRPDVETFAAPRGVYSLGKLYYIAIHNASRL